MKKERFAPPFLPLKKGEKYENYHLEKRDYPGEWFLPSIKMYFHGRFYRKTKKPDLKAWVEEYRGYESSEKPIITWLGHASILIQIENLNILADPIITSPSWLYERVLPFGAEPQALPKIDVVILSHNHRDHMDAATLKLLHKRHKPLFLVPEGNKSWFIRRGMHQVEEFNWWQTWQQGAVDFTFVPAWHWSQRGLFDHNKTLWGGWVISGKEDTVYFAGDTAYCKEYFIEIGKQFPSIDVAIMPIGPCDPDEQMRRSHMNAQESGQAFLDCGARYFIPMHWGTFYFGIDSFDTPIERLNQWWAASKCELQDACLIACKVGQQFHLEHHKNSYSSKHDQNR